MVAVDDDVVVVVVVVVVVDLDGDGDVEVGATLDDQINRSKDRRSIGPAYRPPARTFLSSPKNSSISSALV